MQHASGSHQSLKQPNHQIKYIMLLKKLFGFNPAIHSVKTEILAGITTFLTMAYTLLNALTGKVKTITPTMWVLTVLFIARYALVQ